MGAVAVDVQPGRQQDPVFYRYRTVWKWRNKEFIPTCSRDGEGLRKSMKYEKEKNKTKKTSKSQYKSSHTIQAKLIWQLKGGGSNESIKLCGFLKHQHQVITKTFESRFLKRQACKRDELRLPSQ